MADSYYTKVWKKIKLTTFTPRVEVNLSAKGALCLEELRKNGIAKFPILFDAEADYLLNAYVEQTVQARVGDKEKSAVDVDPKRGKETGVTFWKYITLTDEIIYRIFFQTELLDVLAAYYKSHVYFRRLPFVKCHECYADTKRDISSVYHTDANINQIGVQMLLSDISDADYHMKYLMGSHKRFVAVDERPNINDRGLQEYEKGLEKKFPTYSLTGAKGSLFIFDNGNGLHKGDARVNSTRKILQASFSRGDYSPRNAHEKEMMRADLEALLQSESKVKRTSVKFI
ncbi:MAG TPA: hypothetical protein VK826_04200 [Bacteroidia bacterium]|nr:hypothetical protein [Bacteroidia bacterium]